ncbi:maleylpyruvate isomerase family mycothiol-dependent enzyme [Pseudonocardia sp. WMMC193]|uniref:maleylpyruvate isomerase family mycothiol-dependent enzyme n=1 Tax=Pseudonocardia sp. WMMC193 TaxID=2911965 RepID=UPI001F1E4354|nr:maleylpyruvate isomerase family mycothiol-dependent enzyme [Pseudonocardia sp. WMMC193]MCF7551918.1 maleylpyruvate isomerase family mycothiol-dependent enzyme [Pseudonocardia sp. WMMC193]
MSDTTFTRHCAEIVGQTAQLVREVSGADPDARVPGCPDWTLGMLVRHLAAGHRWATEIVRTRASEFLDDTELRVLRPGPVAWDELVPGARALADTLRAAGPDAEVWTPFIADGTRFWARRFAFETLVHRLDATQAAGLPVTVSPDTASAALDEWCELDAHPFHLEVHPRRRELSAPGRTLALEAPGRRWFADLTGAAVVWRHSAEPAAVTVRGSVPDLLLFVYGRPNTVSVSGDRSLLGLWREHVAFA